MNCKENSVSNIEFAYHYYASPTNNTQTYQLLAREHARELQSPFVRNLDIMSQ